MALGGVGPRGSRWLTRRVDITSSRTHGRHVYSSDTGGSRKRWDAIGSVSIVHQDMPDRPESRDLGPWVGGTYVVPEARNRRVGVALMRAVERAAAALSIDRLYMHTSTAKGFYEKLGWELLDEDSYQGERVTIMVREIPLSASS